MDRRAMYWEKSKDIVILMLIFLFFLRKNYILCEQKSHVCISTIGANYGVFSQIKLNLYFPGTNFLVAWSEGNSRSESSPVKPVRQFWIKRFYPTWSVALTVDCKIKVNLQSRVLKRWTNAKRYIQYYKKRQKEISQGMYIFVHHAINYTIYNFNNIRM